MTRRALLAAVFAPAAFAERGPDFSEESMNRFADLYNKFVGRLKEGVFDAHQWRAVQTAWRRISGE